MSPLQLFFTHFGVDGDRLKLWRRAMTKIEIDNQKAKEISWRHFWLANVIADIDGAVPVRVIRPEMRTSENSLTRRLHKLRDTKKSTDYRDNSWCH
jgi:hypothetical protein